MDIKKRIQELSLDQKAKLYYMMLLKKGAIDTLPENPKAAYVQSMMDEPASSKFSEPIGEDLDDYRLEPEDMEDPDEDLVIIGSGYLDIKSNFKGRPNMTNDELATLGQKVVDQLHNGDKEAAFDYITSRLEEGSCGYGPDGVPGDTPGETRGMPADTRTMTMMRESIRKEIKRLHENK